MTDKKYTDEEIIKGLECMLGMINNDIEYSIDCNGCAFEDNALCSETCSEGIAKYALDIINRQKAEIEALYQINAKSEKEIYELRKELLSKENLEESFKKSVKDFDKRLEKIVKLERAAAYKKFADKLEEKYGIFTPLGVNWIEEAMAVRVSDIDKILKEMLGEEE